MFEVSALSFQHISIALEHPFEESMATVEFNMTDTSEIECKIYSINVSYDAISVKLSKILEKCMSIPITLRALIKCWEQEKNIQRNLDNGNFNMQSGPNDSAGRNDDFRDLKSKSDRSGLNGGGIFPSSGNSNGNGGAGSFSEHTMFSGGNNDSLLHHEPPYSDSDISKRQRTEDFWKNPKSEILSNDMLEHQSSDSSDSNSLGTTSGVATPSSNASFATESGSDPISIENVTTDSQKAALEDDQSTEMRDLMDSEKKKVKKTTKDQRSELSEENKGNLPPSVSITPITSTSGFSSVLTGLERRLGIEIIPISSTPPPNIKSSITITPINSTKGSVSSGDKSSSNASKRSDDRSKIDKKKKRKRDDSPMGPPEKMPFKQDPLSRPVSVSIKTNDGAPLSPSGLLRKFATSPVPGKNSTSAANSGSKPSPKHSPAHHSSPKHQDLSSPKNQYGTSSPKHPTSGGSGKPSMSALKSAANSPNSKSDKMSSKSSTNREGGARDKDRERDKDRDRSLKFSSGNSPKLIKSSVKLKQIDLTAALLPSDALLDASSSSQDSNKSSGNPAKIRKGSINAVIDKLKSAQHIPADEALAQAKSTPSSLNNSFQSGTTATGNSKEKTNFLQSNLSSSGNNSEYMVKPSSDGMKITINKTRTKDSSSPSHSTSSSSSRHSPGSNSGSNSPKTGLKPGVNSGPASKKPQNQSTLAQNNNKITAGTNNSVAAKPSFQRSSSSGNLNPSKSASIAKGSGSSSSDSFSKKDKSRPYSKGGNYIQLFSVVYNCLSVYRH